MVESVERPKMSSKLPPPSFLNRALRATLELSGGASADEAAPPLAPLDAAAAPPSASALLRDAFAGLGLVAVAAAPFLPLGELRSGLADFLPAELGADSWTRFFRLGAGRCAMRGEAAREGRRAREVPVGLHGQRHCAVSRDPAAGWQTVLNEQDRWLRSRPPTRGADANHSADGTPVCVWISHLPQSAAGRWALPLRAEGSA